MLVDGDFEDLHKLTRSMLAGELKNYSNIMKLFQEEELIYTGDENQPVVRFIPEARKILKQHEERYDEWRERHGL